MGREVKVDFFFFLLFGDEGYLRIFRCFIWISLFLFLEFFKYERDRKGVFRVWDGKWLNFIYCFSSIRYVFYFFWV